MEDGLGSVGVVAERFGHGGIGDAASVDIEPGAQMPVFGNRLEAAVGELQSVLECRIVERVRRRDRHRPRHVRNAVMHDAFDLIGRFGVRRRMRRLEAAALVDRDIDNDGAFFMADSISRVTSFGAAAPGMSTAPITMSAEKTSSSKASIVE